MQLFCLLLFRKIVLKRKLCEKYTKNKKEKCEKQRKKYDILTFFKA